MKSPPGPEPPRPLPPARPRRPRRALLVVSTALLAAWVLFLILVAWRVI